MADRIIHDPHLEVMPDHTGPYYEIPRNALVQNGMPLEQAIQVLDNSWALNHDARILAWDQQVADDVAVAQQNQAPQHAAPIDQAPQQQEPENPVPHAQPIPEGNEPENMEDAEKKRPKMKDFDDTVTVGNFIAPRPAQYALHHIEDFEYVELWYLTQEGCSDATQYQLTQHDDAFGLAKVNDLVTFKSFSSLRASKNVIPDAELSFRQMSMAKNAFIPLMAKYQWSAKAISAFAQLFTQLEMHPLRQQEYGEQALIVYQAKVRREWHDQMKLGLAFNIGVINEDLLQRIYRELLDKAQLLSISRVSRLVFPLTFCIR